jgi:hypothetical protein
MEAGYSGVAQGNEVINGQPCPQDVFWNNKVWVCLFAVFPVKGVYLNKWYFVGLKKTGDETVRFTWRGGNKTVKTVSSYQICQFIS